MKKIFFILLLVFALQTQAQNYLPLPDSNAVWMVDQDDGGPGPDIFRKYVTDYTLNDTIINSTPYIKLYFDDIIGGWYVGGYRSDTTGKTFFVPSDSIQEFLLIDLNVNQGDTVFNVLHNDGGIPPLPYSIKNAVVDSINFVSVGPYLLKRVYVHFPPEWDENVWIEKIGSTGGFFNRTEPLNYTFLYCMSFADTIFFHCSYAHPSCPSIFYYHGNCDSLLNTDNIEIDNDISIFPNPVFRQLYIKWNSPAIDTQIKIYNSLSQLVFYGNNFPGESMAEIDFEKLSPSVYYLLIEEKGKRIAGRKIIKM